MKEAIFSLILQILMVSAIGRAQVTDDFSDGDFNYNPRWQGDSLHFEVNSSKQLHLKWTGNDTSFLATWGTWVPEIEWNFWIKLSFNTSVNNFMKVYLTADRMELDQSLNGSFLQVGGGNDSLYIMKQTGLTSQMLFHFPDVSTVHSTNTLRIKITCDATGLWNAWVDASGGQNFIEEGTWVDTTSPTLFWFGFWCKYTSSNATKCYMDDIYIGPVVRDTIPPSLSALMIPDSMHLSLRFSEDLEQTEALNCTNYTLMGSLNHPEMISVTSGSPCELMLHFGTPFQEQVMDTLMITNLVDLAGNRMPDTLVPFTLFEPGAYDILIHEVMMDPEPTVGLPPVEFIELYNQTGFSVDLSGWFLDIGSTRKTFPSVIIPANGFLLLARDSSLSGYGQTVSLFTSGSSLANEGTTLVLRNSRLQIIHTMTYTPEWIDEEWKSDGGWSLEMIDPANPCGCGDNWSVAEDPRGGTPGGTNSVYRINPDLNPPEVLRSFLVGDTVWEIRFSEPIDTTNPGSPWLWSLASNGMHPESLFFVSP
ncbi:MAG: lamin tail domain-containing protein, partial [Bacteroidales bacterium]|nr:lamin tail domain-containing protein [Bacteroidales bacterium]